jgi:hypothetical protein
MCFWSIASEAASVGSPTVIGVMGVVSECDPEFPLSAASDSLGVSSPVLLV